MADDKKPQKGEVAKPAVKKATKKKAPGKKRVAPKKAATKKAAPKKRTAKKETAGATPPVTAANDAPPPPARMEVLVERPATTSTVAAKSRHVWWRAALMIAVVVGLFVTIRNAAHNEPAITDKAMAINPWGEESPSMEAVQPHPWELAPTPQAGDFGSQQPYYASPPQPPTYRQEPWQPLSDASQPYYPPPPGPYGAPPSASEAAPYPR